MKKNKMMRAASALLVAVLLTTCVISGTYAKYTTSNSALDSARVAKWGFETTELTIDMFAAEYNGTVDASDDKDVVAPGTTKTFTVALLPTAGTPEVKYHFDANISTVSADADLLDKLVWSLNGSEVGNFAALVTAIDTAYDKDYDVNTLPIDEIEITWNWPYYESDAEDGTDTALGNASTPASLEVKFSFTATQLD